MLSVNTNAAAQIALQNLNRVNSSLEQTQRRISTGLEVASAKDDGGIFAIAQRLRSEAAGLGVVQNSLARGVSTVDVALAAGESISDLLIEMKEKALAASDASLDTASRDALNEDFEALRDQIATVVDNAEFNGINLLNGSTNAFEALANQDGSSVLTVQDEDLSLSGAIITLTTASDIDTVTEATNAITTIETSLDNLNSALARLGTASKSLEIMQDFTTKILDETEVGIGSLVDADLAKESANLQAQQTQQQLATQALGIANQAPQAISLLFHNLGWGAGR